MQVNQARRLALIVLGVALVLGGCTGWPVDDGASPTESLPGETPAAGDGAPDGSLAVHAINVGQSSSTLVVAPTGETILVDTGDFTDDGEHVLAYLERHGVDRIDHLVVSHNDADHIGGNAAVIEHLETEGEGVGAVYDPGIAASTETYSEYLDAVETHDVTLYETREGDSIPVDGVDVAVLGPPEPYIESEARNENSVVLRLAFGETSVLLPGDAEDDQEAYLVDNYGEKLDATVLLAGHHGSAGSSSPAFLDAVAPAVVVVSSAYDSRYGHPHEETLDRFAERSLPTFWTATHGDVVLVSDGSEVTIRSQRAAPTFPRVLRDGDPVPPGTADGVTTRARITGGGVETPVATDGGTAAATPEGTDGELAVATIHADAAGDDRENLADEYVVFENVGEGTLDLAGWTVSDESGRRYTVPAGTTLAPGERLTLYTGSGTDTDGALYWDAGRPIWNNDGDTVTVTSRAGDVRLTESYP